jgi:hypothetical protein
MTTIPDRVSTLELSKLLIYKALKKIEAENNPENNPEASSEQKESK